VLPFLASDFSFQSLPGLTGVTPFRQRVASGQGVIRPPLSENKRRNAKQLGDDYEELDGTMQHATNRRTLSRAAAWRC
jgi:hypothetical protein